MAYVMTGFIYIMNIIYLKVKIKTKSKKWKKISMRISVVLFFSLFLIMWILMGANYNNPDYNSYLTYYYNYGGVVSPDKGFTILNSLFKNRGFSYEQFRMIISLFSFILLHQTIKKFTDKPVVVYLLFFLYPFMLEIVQIRNFLMMSIVLFAIPYLLEKNYKASLKFMGLILIASTIHIAALIYLPLVIFVKVKKSTLIKSLLTLLVIIGIVAGINKSIFLILVEPFINIFSTYDSRFDVYSVIQTRLGYFLYWGIQIVGFLITNWSKNIIYKYKNISLYKYKFVRLTHWINIYFLLFMPLYIFEITYFRYARNMLILNFIVYTLTSKSLKRNKRKRILYNTVIIAFTIFTFYVSIYAPHKDIIKMIFEYNWLIG